MPASITPELSVDDIDDLLYYTRVNDEVSLEELITKLTEQLSCSAVAIITQCIDPEDGNTSLHFCSANGFTQLLSKLLKLLKSSAPGSEAPDQQLSAHQLINHQNARGNTALHWAAYNGHLETVKTLIAAGADMWIKNASGHLALFEAEQAEKSDVVQFLLESGGSAVEQATARSSSNEESAEIAISAGDMSAIEDETGMNVPA